MKKKLVFLLVSLFISISFACTNVDAKTLIDIDYPANNIKYENTLTISGWVMSDIPNTNVKLLVDGKELQNIYRWARPDVLSVVQGYGNKSENPTPGYVTDLDMSDFAYGKHTLEVQVLDSSNTLVLSSEKKNFEKKTPNSLIDIDYPIKDGTYKNTLNINGWVMSDIPNTNVKLLVDGKELTGIYRWTRPDVLSIVRGYGSKFENPTPGYSTNLDITDYTYGNHTLEVKLYDSVGRLISSETRNFNKEAPKSLIDIDSPTVNGIYKENLDINGWVMSDIPNTNIKLFIDDKEINSMYRWARPDVLSVVHGYGTRSENPMPGYSTSIDLTDYTYGNHTFEVKVYDNSDRLISSEKRLFKKEAPQSLINIDSPNSNEFYRNSLTISGWAMSESSKTNVKLYIDGNELSNVYRWERPDVLNVIHGYGTKRENPNPGYLTTVDLSNLTYGTHSLEVSLVDKKGLVLNNKRTKFYNSKPKTYITIDNPKENETKDRNLLLSGWVMSESKDIVLKTFVDDKEVTSNITRTQREDVLNVIHDYGTKRENPNPGFVTNLDLSSYNEGIHRVTVKAYSKLNEIVSERSILFNLQKYYTYLNILSPKMNSTHKTSFEISGVMLSENEQAIVKIYLDDNLINDNAVRNQNYDFDKNFNLAKFGDNTPNKTPKFSYLFDGSKLSDGEHTIKMDAILPNNELAREEKVKFNIKKYDGTITLDYPASSNININSDIFIRGWRMSEDSNDSIEAYIDNTKISNIDYTERGDVLNAIHSYGGTNTNSMPGFQTSAPASNFGVGTHTLRINDLNSMGEIITTYTKVINIYDQRMYGIDVSEFQGPIDWTAVKASQMVDFAYIRYGFRGFGGGSLNKDSRFDENFRNANNVGIKTGIYFFTQAVTYDEGVQEANYVISNLSITDPNFRSKMKLPVAIDVEPSGAANNSGRADRLQDKTMAVKGFTDQIKRYGLTPIIYASPSYISKHLNMNVLSDVDVWLAHWTYSASNPSNYQGNYSNWQYANNGAIPGINGHVDLNVSYKMY